MGYDVAESYSSFAPTSFLAAAVTVLMVVSSVERACRKRVMDALCGMAQGADPDHLLGLAREVAMRWMMAGLGVVMLAGGAQALETPMQYVPPREPSVPPAQQPIAQQPLPAAPQDLSAGDRLRAVLGQPADCPPDQGAKPPESGV